jgi:hypothetical protein
VHQQHRVIVYREQARSHIGSVSGQKSLHNRSAS